MDLEAQCAVLREALQAALQSHVKLGKAAPCDCSLCHQMRAAIEPGAGAEYADRLRAECAQVADWKVTQLNTALAAATGPETEVLRAASRAVREVADRIRVLMNRQL
jgi:hypothetical protein